MLQGKILRAQFYDRALTPDAVVASAGVESNFVSETELLGALDGRERAEWEELRAEAVRIREEVKSIKGTKRKIYTVRADAHPGPARGHPPGRAPACS